MSEPYSLILSLPIGAQALRQAMGQPSPAADQYTDWAELEVELDPTVFARAAATRGWSARHYLSVLREGARAELGWMFQFDPRAERLLCITVLWAESMGEIVGGLAVLRGLAPAVRPDTARPGHVLVHDFVFGTHGTACAVLMGGGGSRLLPGTAPQVAPLVDEAAPIVAGLIAQAGTVFEGDVPHDPDRLLVDQFPSWG